MSTIGEGRPLNRPTEVGDRFGRWEVKEAAASKRYRKIWMCLCDCGTYKPVLDQNLRRGKSESCGCLPKDLVSTGHGDILGVYWSSLRAGARNRGILFEVTIQEGWDLFERQQGRCALSGVPLRFATNTQDYWAGGNTASLDRIDSDLGYQKNNIQWLHKTVNQMKFDLKQGEFLGFCVSITKTVGLVEGPLAPIAALRDIDAALAKVKHLL